jgi:hypothetical protein
MSVSYPSRSPSPLAGLVSGTVAALGKAQEEIVEKVKEEAGRRARRTRNTIILVILGYDKSKSSVGPLVVVGVALNTVEAYAYMCSSFHSPALALPSSSSRSAFLFGLGNAAPSAIAQYLATVKKSDAAPRDKA